MSFKVFFRSVVFLVIFFLMVYLGVNNTEQISFRFPGVLKETLRSQACFIFFGCFAVGVLAGTVLTAGSGGRKSSGSREK